MYLLKELVEFYKKTEQHLQTAETYELIQQLDPHTRYETNICYYYSRAGKKNLKLEWAEKAYQKNPSAVNAYNLALEFEYSDVQKYEKLMEEAVKGGEDAAFLVYGKYLKSKDNNRANQLFQKAFDIWEREFNTNRLEENDYSRLIEVAELLGKYDLAQKVRNEQNERKKKNKNQWFNADNLATDRVDIKHLSNSNNNELPF